jgi:tetratricopeptide (TPR) repeat protein
MALMKGNKRQAQAYADSCLQIHQPLVGEFEDLPNEYLSRLRIALAYALKGDSRKALEQVESVRNSLGESVFTLEWALGQELGLPLSFVYSLAGEKEEAVRLLNFLVKINMITPAYIKLHPWYRNLAGYPAFEELIGRRIE